MSTKITPRNWKSCIGELALNCQEYSDSEYIFSKFVKVIKNNEKLKQHPDDFFRFINRCYYHSALLLIRRLSDKKSESISLVTLLKSFLDYSNDFMKVNEKKYQHYKLKSSQISDDLCEIIQICKPVNKIINKKGVAHLDINTKIYTFNQIEFNEAMDVLKSLSNKYFKIFGYAGFGGDEYEIAYDWQSIFAIPWIEVS